MSEHSGLILPADLRAGVEPSDVVTTIDGEGNKNYTMQACERARGEGTDKKQEDDGGRTASNERSIRKNN